jgi:molybdate transport system permease protein
MAQRRGTVLMLDWQPIFLSLKVAALALALAFGPGIVLARWLARARFWGKEVIEAFFLLPLVLPPVVTGYALLVLLGRQGMAGVWLEQHWKIRLLFTPTAAVLASAVVAFPLVYQSAKAAFQNVDPLLEGVARALGASPLRVFFSITAPLAAPGLAAGAVLAFARALGEFGATIMVAGNIEGRTTTMPTAIYMAAEGGDLQLAGKYSILLGVANLLFVLAIGLWSRQKNRAQKL